MIKIVLVGRTIPGFNRLTDRVSKTFKSPITTEMIDFPLTRSFRSQRSQYHADTFLRELSNVAAPEGDLTVFIVREDIYSGNLNFVFGLAGRKACIVSTARLDPRFYGKTEDMDSARALFEERLLKEVIHEVGHSLGLPHCEDKKCVMVFSSSIEDVDYKGVEFCAGCKKVIKTYLG